MTKEEIMNMSAGREMDDLVAEKVMGFERADDDWTGMRGWKMGPNSWSSVFKASTDIGAALEAMDKFRKPFSKRIKFIAALRRVVNHELIEAEADIRMADSELVWNMTPLNICRAALLTTIDTEG